jgi:predicted enzyme related to lactoylglutathione lyase
LIEVERTDFVTVPVEDLERAERFYSETLGLPRSQGREGMFAEFETGNLTISLFNFATVGREVGRHGAPIALRVPNVEAARSELESRGVEFYGDILDSGVCHMAFFQDTEGNALMLHRRYAPPPA